MTALTKTEEAVVAVNREAWTAVASERKAVVERLWKRIQKAAPAPDSLTDPIHLSWRDLIRFLDEERSR